MVALTCMGQLRKRNWLTFGSPRSSKNKPSLKTLFLLYDEKIHPVHKRSESGPEISEASLIISTF